LMRVHDWNHKKDFAAVMLSSAHPSHNNHPFAVRKG